MKDVWKSARVEDGVLCVMTTGIILMPVWSADSWDSQASVCFILNECGIENTVP